MWSKFFTMSLHSKITSGDTGFFKKDDFPDFEVIALIIPINFIRSLYLTFNALL